MFSGAMIVSGQDIAADAYQGIGGFSVGDGKTVIFSPGNLQYHPKNDEWRFAENQIDYLGERNWYISADYEWIDLFGWSGSDGSAKFGVSRSQNDADYAGTFVDWGTNKIGNDAPNTWRTLTDDEWSYLCRERPNAKDLLGVAEIYVEFPPVNGLILLPDNWTCPAGVTFRSGYSLYMNGPYDYESHQTFTADQWSKLEAAGAVFLPAINFNYGSYWATEYNGNRPHFFYIESQGVYLDIEDADVRNIHRAVRLVKDL
jgi:hypothetical protein